MMAVVFGTIVKFLVQDFICMLPALYSWGEWGTLFFPPYKVITINDKQNLWDNFVIIYTDKNLVSIFKL